MKPATPTPWKAMQFSSVVGIPIMARAVVLAAVPNTSGKEATQADAAYIVHAANNLPKVIEALKYWMPDESWMQEKYPNHKHDAWGTFYEHCALLRELGEAE